MKRFLLLLLCMTLTIVCCPAVRVQAETKGTIVDSTHMEVYACDTTDGWVVGGSLRLDTENQTQGDACVAIRKQIDPNTRNTNFTAAVTFEPVDVSSMTSFAFDFYISDPTLIPASYAVCVDISSAGSASEECISWYSALTEETCKEGWNHIELPMNEAEISGFHADRMNFFRIYFFRINGEKAPSEVEIKIDNITAASTAMELRQMDACDTDAGWTRWDRPVILDFFDKSQGIASLSFPTYPAEGGNMVSQKVYEIPFDASGALYVEMDVYVSDLGALRSPDSRYGMHFEISSSGECDHREYEWDLADYILQKGWNHIKLPIGEGVKTTDGAPDMSAINFLRFHMLELKQTPGDAWVFKVDNICFSFPVTVSETPVEPGDPENPDTSTEPGASDGTEPVDDAAALRVRKTEQRARLVLVLMCFIIIGADVVAVALRRRPSVATPEDELPETEE